MENASGCEFDRMADIPLLQRARIGLNMELQRQGPLTIGESLIVIEVTGGEPRGAAGQVKRFAVPMKCHGIGVGERRQAR
jgi:hypothetical protein